VFVDDGGDLSCRSRRRRRRWRDGEESLKSESLVKEQLHLVEIEIGTEGGTGTIGHALAHHPLPIVPHHVHGQGHGAGNSVVAHHQKAAHIQIKYVPRAEIVPEGHIPGINKLFCIDYEIV
jgi:hypothetical protein